MQYVYHMRDAKWAFIVPAAAARPEGEASFPTLVLARSRELNRLPAQSPRRPGGAEKGYRVSGRQAKRNGIPRRPSDSRLSGGRPNLIDIACCCLVLHFINTASYPTVAHALSVPRRHSPETPGQPTDSGMFVLQHSQVFAA